MNAEEVVDLLRAQVKEAGSISEYSRRTGIHPATISNTLSGCNKRPGPSIVTALGLKAVVIYEPIK